MAHFNFDTCPVPKAAAAYRFLHLSAGLHCAPLSNATHDHVTARTYLVPLPCESSQNSHSKTSTSVAVIQPLSFGVCARRSASIFSRYPSFLLLAGLP